MERVFNRNFILIVVASLFMFTAFYLLMPIIATYIIDVFDADPSVAGVIVSAYIITALLTRPFSGYLVDRFDRRKFYMLVFGLFTITMSGYILSNSLGGLMLTRVILGASFALVTTAANTLAIDVSPSNKRATAIGYFGAIIVLSMAVGPMLGLYLIETISYNGLFICALACCCCGLVLTPFIKTKPREAVEHAPFSLDRFFVREGVGIATIIGLVYFLYGSLMVYVSLYIRENTLDYSSASFFLLFSFGIIASRTSIEALMNHFSKRVLLPVGIFTILISGSIFVFWLNDTTFLITSSLMGFGFGLIGPLVQTMIVDLVPASRRGSATSTYFTALDCGSGLGMLIGGTLVSMWGYQGLFTVGLSLTLISLILSLKHRELAK